MIAVVANDSDRPVIREFFELFKTPWEFYRPGGSYNALISADGPFEKSAAPLVVLYGAKREVFDQQNRLRTECTDGLLSYRGEPFPIYGECCAFRGAAAHPLAHERTRQPAVCEISSPGQILIRVGFDLFYEIRHLLTRGQPPAYAGSPALELHIALLRDFLLNHAVSFVEIPPVPAGFGYVACLTHDVDHAGIRHHLFDHTFFGFLYRATIGSIVDFCRRRRSLRQLIANWTAALSLPFVQLGWVKDFWAQFDRYLELEDGSASTFFVIPAKGDAGRSAGGRSAWKRAARYDLASIKPQLEKVAAAGCEVALHGIDAWHDVAKGRSEVEAVRRFSGGDASGVRIHWLFFDEKSPATLEEAGCSYDSTIGYNETVGYRAGTTQVYKPLGVERLLELPLHVMDTAMFYPDYLNLSPQEFPAVVDRVLQNARRFGGVVTVNWHDRSIAPERSWEEPYVDLLARLKSDGVWFATAAQAVAWFRKRRTAAIQTFEDAGKRRAKVVVDGDDDDTPGLRIRVHHPSVRTDGSSGEIEAENTFLETVMSGAHEVEVPL